MKGLNDVRWKDFRIEDIFEIVSGQDIYEKERIEGNTPYITATANQNGIGYFVGNRNKSLEKGCISVNRNGSVGYAFYHPYIALFGNDTRKLRPKTDKSYACFFMSRCITSQKDKFGYGLKLGTDRLKKQSIMLPVTDEGEPDYIFMEQYMKAIETKLLTRYQSYLATHQHNLLNNNKLLMGGGKIKWKTFKIDQIFSITATQSSIDKKLLEGKLGRIPYITRSDKNNGIDTFVEEQTSFMKDEQNTITVGLDTQTVFYQSKSFYTGQNIQIFQSDQLNRSTALFIIPLLKQQFSKFNWGGNGATLGRLKKLSIMFPVTPNCQPDYRYMESFMKELESKLVNRYVNCRFSTKYQTPTATR